MTLVESYFSRQEFEMVRVHWKFKLSFISLFNFGVNWASLDKSGQVRTSLDKFGQVWTS